MGTVSKVFKNNDKVIDENYGQGYVINIDPDYIWGLNSKEVGRIIVNFDSKTIQFTMDGREFPVDSGYYCNGEFKPYISKITLRK
jgi:hypothetical protein